jgi:GT2 family glycosyltransferase
MSPLAEAGADGPSTGQVGLVIIGRNEGARLVASLRSLGPYVRQAVYVDSGSTDGSVAAAGDMGANVVELDTDIPFTAARARNAGVEALLSARPAVSLIQFLDGDCSLREDWIAEAVDFLASHPDVAIVCGRRRERYPERSIYNQLCDREWNGRKGPITECGGDFMVRVESFLAVGGFRSDLIAGEEPELCLRLREQGWSIWRLDREMTWHDADITRFGQWWRRQLRAGHAFAEVSRLHRHSPRRIWQRQFLRAIVWGLVIPLVFVGLSVLFGWQFLFLFLIYPMNIVRIAIREDMRSAESWRAAFFSVLAKFPETVGALKFYARRLTGKRQSIIEYK